MTPEPQVGAPVTTEDSALAAAIRRYEERLARDPGSLAFAPLADAYRKAGRAPDAIRLCREGLERFPAVRDGPADPGQGARSTTAIPTARSTRCARFSRPARRRRRRIVWPATCTGGPAPWATRSSIWSRRCGSIPGTASPARSSTSSGRAGPVPEGSALKQLLADDTFATLSFGTLCLEQGLVDEAAQIFLRLLHRDPGHARARERLEEALRLKTQRRKGS